MHLAQWLDQLDGRTSDGDVGGRNHGGASDEPERARAILEEAAHDVRERLDGIEGVQWPLALPNGRVEDIHRCEGLAVARAAGKPEPPSWAVMRGIALDSYVAHSIYAGPVAAAVPDLQSMWEAEGRDLDLESLAGHLADPDTAAARAGDLESLARQAGAFAAVRGRGPRVEVRVGRTIDDTLALRGRVDVMLGGPGTGRPTVLIEVKSGSPGWDHSAQLRHYVMLCALREGRMPFAAGIWHPGGSPDGLVAGPLEGSESPLGTVRDVALVGAAESSARRVADAVGALAEMWEGRPPRLSGGAHCRWCPASQSCAQAVPGSADAEWDEANL